MAALKRKFVEVLQAVLPVLVIVFLLHFTIAPLSSGMPEKLLLGALFVIPGLTVFLFGIDLSIDRIGKDIGNMLVKSGKLALLIAVGLVLGFFISFAEPDLHILSGEILLATGGAFGGLAMVAVVSAGIAALMTLGMLRVLKSVALKYVFMLSYGLIFVMALFSSKEFLAIAFDASGATTGALTTPFMLALAAGVSSMKKDSRASEADSFGLVGIASSGAIIGVLATALLLGLGTAHGEKAVETAACAKGIWAAFGSTFLSVAKDTFLSLAPIILSYAFFQAFVFKKNRRQVKPVVMGLIMTYLGLVLFLSGVHGGFMEAGREVGMRLGAMQSKAPVLLVSFLLGLVTVLAEPAVIVLTHQIEDVTGGYVRRALVMIFLSLAVGLAIFMAVLRILTPWIELWMYLVFGFGLSCLLAFFVPDLFVGMAFDAGGVASGPMTATFSLAFMQGIALQTGADVVAEGFGMIAIVAMMPILAVETLGFLFKMKTGSK